MKRIRPFGVTFILTVISLLAVAVAASATPPKVSSLFIPLQGDVPLSNGDVVTFTGQVHVLTRVTFSDTFVPAVQMYLNLQGVRGTSASSGRTYLLIGASNVEWVGVSPGPPDIPEQTFNFNLVEINPGPPNQPPGPPDVPPSPILPVFFRDWVFAQEAGSEGSLHGVTASFVSD